MKRILVILLTIALLAGCTHSDGGMERAISLRERLLQAESCTFDAEITADFGDKTYAFTMSCTADREGNVEFTVLQPDTICGITGVLSANGGKLTFDETAVAFEMLADGEVSPISAPWLLYKTLCGGYITSCGEEGESLHISVDDSYEEDALQLDIWLDAQNIPQSAQIRWQGRRVLSLIVKNFTIV